MNEKNYLTYENYGCGVNYDYDVPKEGHHHLW